MHHARTVPILGADIELANFVLAPVPIREGAKFASRVLLAEFEGIPSSRSNGSGVGIPAGRRNPRDHSRKFLGNGACVYIDLDHVEIALPETRTAFEHVASFHAMLREVGEAARRLNARLPEGWRVVVLANTSDREGRSWGSHLNVSMSRGSFEALFGGRIHLALHLASYLAASAVITGQGKVGAENGAPEVPFQLSERADFIETLLGRATTSRRPLLNLRDEPHTGGDRGLGGRLHLICFDTTLTHRASMLRAGGLQIVLAMLEGGAVPRDLLLEDPVSAFKTWSRDPDLRAEAKLLDGRAFTAVDLWASFLENALAFAEAGGLDRVPDAWATLDLWQSTLRMLRLRDTPALARCLDWAMKRSLLVRAIESRPRWDWRSPEIRYLDRVFADLDPREGLYWLLEKEGEAERIVPEQTIEFFRVDPPQDTRAWTRGMLLRSAPEERIERVDWDILEFRIDGTNGGAFRRVTLERPSAYGREECEPLFDGAASLDELLDGLERMRAGESAQVH
jgi:proteasome accessory factor A